MKSGVWNELKKISESNLLYLDFFRSCLYVCNPSDINSLHRGKVEKRKMKMHLSQKSLENETYMRENTGNAKSVTHLKFSLAI